MCAGVNKISQQAFLTLKKTEAFFNEKTVSPGGKLEKRMGKIIFQVLNKGEKAENFHFFV